MTPATTVAESASGRPAAATQHETDVLRHLAQRKLEIAAHPLNLERRALWYTHDAGGGGRPMVLAEFQGIKDRVRPIPDEACECEGEWARALERTLREELYRFEVLKDDHVVEPYLRSGWKVEVSDYGVEVVRQEPDFEGFGARRWDAPLRDLDKDFDHLRHRSYAVDREGTLAEKERLEQVFAGLLPVRIRGGFWWTMGLTWTAIELIGMERMMLMMYDNPDGLHRLMCFLCDDHLAYADWLESEGLLCPNDENDYIGSGSMGYTRDFQSGADTTSGSDVSGAGVNQRDQWVLLESQETVGVSPAHFEAFVFPYQKSIAERFGKCYYGCCEQVHDRIHILKNMPNLARVSVSPWANQEIMAAELGREIVFSRKPNPAMISTETFDEKAIRADLRQTLAVARDCRVELIMKDVHTLNNEPERLPRWVEMARQEIDAI